VQRLQGEFAKIPQALVFAANTPSWGTGNDKEVEFVVRAAGASLEELSAVVSDVRGRLAELPGLVNLDSDLRMSNPTLDIRFDREQAADVDVPVSAISESLRLLVSEGKTDEFVLRNRQYDVVMALASPFRSVPEQLGEIHVRSNNGAMVPLAGLIDAIPRSGPTYFNHHQLQRSARLSANLAAGTHLGDVLPKVDAILEEALPDGFNRAFTGFSRDFLESQGQLVATFGASLLVVYLVLAAQFESFLHPLAVMLGVPLALLGALATLALSGTTLNLYSEIGIILLIGLVTKNAILLVDFTNQERARGTAILGAVPLMLASGAGAESRQPIGAAVVGGLLFSTIFTLVVIPVVHVLLIRAAERFGWNTVPPKLELDAESVAG
jgi:multidrug efflux pump